MDLFVSILLILIVMLIGVIAIWIRAKPFEGSKQNPRKRIAALASVILLLCIAGMAATIVHAARYEHYSNAMHDKPPGYNIRGW